MTLILKNIKKIKFTLCCVLECFFLYKSFYNIGLVQINLQITKKINLLY